MTGHLPEPEGRRIPGSRALYLEFHHRRGSDRCKVTSLSGWQHITPESAQDFWVSTALSATAPQTCYRACKSHSKHHCKARKDSDVYFLHTLGFGMIPLGSDRCHLITCISECRLTEGSVTPALVIPAAKGDGHLLLSKGLKGKEGLGVYTELRVFKAGCYFKALTHALPFFLVRKVTLGFSEHPRHARPLTCGGTWWRPR